ncbi:MAG: hypothetical protein ACT4QC_04555 [Planctomycetaceae bacterium]
MTDHNLEEALRACTFCTSPELDAQVLDSVPKAQSKSSDAGTPPPRPSPRKRGREWSTARRSRVRFLAAGGALVALAALSWFLWQPTDSWAQVKEAVWSKPWIHCKYLTPEEEPHEDWLSLARGVSADRYGDWRTFSDHRLNVNYTYNPKERTLTRRLMSRTEGQQEFDRGFQTMLEQIFRGADQLDLGGRGFEIVEQKRQAVAKHGKAWQCYELDVRATTAENVGDNPTLRWTFLVDPQTRLPRYLEQGHPSMDPLIEVEISYPEKGPLDIYDMGVPRDTKLVDCVPNGDLLRIISEIKSSAERFEPHRAFNILSEPDSPWYVGTPIIVWRKGTSSRFVAGVIDAAESAAKAPDPDVDQGWWWKNRWRELFHTPIEVCDGKTFWNNEERPQGWGDRPSQATPLTWRRADWPSPKWKARPERSPWPAGSSPLFVAYPQNLVNVSAFSREPLLEFQPIDGPQDTVKVTLFTGTPEAPGEERFWVDPQRGHMVVRHEVGEFIQVVEAADRSPGGHWYPTVMRHTSVSTENGQKKTTETVTRHYLDFDVKFTDDLFKPVERPGEPLE